MTPIEQGAYGLTPREIMTYLDRYVIGQSGAKRAVAIALRNRMRRRAAPARCGRVE